MEESCLCSSLLLVMWSYYIKCLVIFACFYLLNISWLGFWWLQEDDDIINSWNLRKCSAAGLDILSTVYGDEILPVLMPLVQVCCALFLLDLVYRKVTCMKFVYLSNWKFMIYGFLDEEQIRWQLSPISIICILFFLLKWHGVLVRGVYLEGHCFQV